MSSFNPAPAVVPNSEMPFQVEWRKSTKVEFNNAVVGLANSLPDFSSLSVGRTKRLGKQFIYDRKRVNDKKSLRYAIFFSQKFLFGNYPWQDSREIFLFRTKRGANRALEALEASIKIAKVSVVGRQVAFAKERVRQEIKRAQAKLDAQVV